MDSPRGRSASAVTTAAPASGLAASPWELDPGTARVGFEVPYWWGLGTVKGRFTRDRVEARVETLAVWGTLAARGRGIEIEVEAAVRPIADDYEVAAEVFVMHRGLGMTWNPLGITRPYSKLIVRGALIPAPADTAPRRHELAPTVRDDLASYRPVRLRRGRRAHLRRRCPSR
jgi:hypothetical protein